MSNIIYLELEGMETFAWITEIKSRHAAMYKVSFKNEYENIFFTDIETGEWIEEDLGFTKLAAEVGKQIYLLSKKIIHVPKMLIWHTQQSDQKLISFGFYSYLKGNKKMFEIYSPNRKFMYMLIDMKKDEWQIIGNSSSVLNQIDPLFVEQVINILNLYTEDYK